MQEEAEKHLASKIAYRELGAFACRESDLTYAVGPDFNAIHHNHFRLDRGGWLFRVAR